MQPCKALVVITAHVRAACCAGPPSQAHPGPVRARDQRAQEAAVGGHSSGGGGPRAAAGRGSSARRRALAPAGGDAGGEEAARQHAVRVWGWGYACAGCPGCTTCPSHALTFAHPSPPPRASPSLSDAKALPALRPMPCLPALNPHALTRPPAPPPHALTLTPPPLPAPPQAPP